ncbi:hypothetical protein EDD22DRAFT_843731 [Suillus occidentalis]|nr:hypothetical protein EDD22DRAFT_843731 [Suillus occidentalis]
MESEKDAVKDDEEGTDAECGDEEEVEPAPAKRPMKSKPKCLIKKSTLAVVSDGEEASTSKTKTGHMSVPNRLVVYSKLCGQCAKMDLKCYGIPGLCCTPCCNAKSSCLHLSQHGKCKGTKAAAKAPSITGTIGTSKAVPADPPVEVTDGEGPSLNACPAKKAKEAIPSVMEEREEVVEEKDKDTDEMQFLTRAELECMEAQFIQMEGMMKEMAVGMKFVHGCMDRVDKRKRCD